MMLSAVLLFASASWKYMCVSFLITKRNKKVNKVAEIRDKYWEDINQYNRAVTVCIKMCSSHLHRTDNITPEK